MKRYFVIACLLLLCGCSSGTYKPDLEPGLCEWYDNMLFATPAIVCDTPVSKKFKIELSVHADFWSLGDELIILTSDQILYRGCLQNEFESNYIVVCDDDGCTKYEEIIGVVLDHKTKKVYHWQEKEVYILAKASKIKITLGYDGYCRIKCR